MSIIAYVLAAFSALWIDYGWQPLAGGGNEYIIQVPPELIDTLDSEGIESYVPPGVENIRRIRIMVGREPLPRTVATPPEASSAVAAKELQTEATPSANDAEQRVAKYAGESSGKEARDDSPLSAPSPDVETAVEHFGLDALTLAGIGLGIAAALVIFLAWANLSMRARYRALLDQRYELRHVR